MSEPLIDAIRQIRNSMDNRGWRVLVLRYGLDGYDPASGKTMRKGGVRNRNPKDSAVRTLEEVGDEMGVTRERIRQIESRTLKWLRHPSRRRIVQGAIVQQKIEMKVRPLEFAHSFFVGVLGGCPGEFPAPDRWITFLSYVFPDVPEFSPPDRQLEDPKKLLKEQLDQNGGSIDATEFAKRLEESGVAGDVVNKIMAGLYQADLGYAWIDGVILVTRHKEVARFVLRDAGEPLHWKEIHKRASKLPLRRELGASTFYNAIGAAGDVFVYRGPGTYGLREWGMEPKRFQKDVLVEWFRGSKRNATVSEIEHALKSTEDEISRSSITLYLGTHELFYEDLDGKFGLREWLPPPAEQRLDTPRHLREAARSRRRLEKGESV